MPDSRFIYVEVIYDFAGNRLIVEPSQIVLDNNTGAVVWWSSNLPQGRSLVVSFTGQQGPLGPFVSLSSQDGLVIGIVNVGHNPEGEGYPYQVSLTGDGQELPGEGWVINNAENDKIGSDPFNTVICDRTVDPPQCSGV